MYFCHLSYPLLLLLRSCCFCPLLCLKCSLGISNFLKEIASLSHSVVFLYFFALVTQEGFFISPCCSLQLCILYPLNSKEFLFPFSPLSFASLPFSAVCKPSSDNHFAFFHFFFLGMVLVITSCTVLGTSIHSSSGSFSAGSSPLNLFITSTV